MHYIFLSFEPLIGDIHSDIATIHGYLEHLIIPSAFNKLMRYTGNPKCPITLLLTDLFKLFGDIFMILFNYLSLPLLALT